MNREDIIRMAQDTGLWDRIGYPVELERLAIEIAAAARKEEREACALIAEQYEEGSGGADAIRARSNK